MHWQHWDFPFISMLNIKENRLRPEFTDWQKHELCYLVGDWYGSWKDRLINWEEKTNNLSKACYHLIAFIADNTEKYKLSEYQYNFIFSAIILWRNMNKDNIVSSYEDKTHHFGHRKETLKLLICDDVEEIEELLGILKAVEE